jgi:hypothetical protein
MIELLVVILLVIIIIILLVIFSVIMDWRAELRNRGRYNLEFPADFSVADQDQKDRFDTEGIGRHHK